MLRSAPVGPLRASLAVFASMIAVSPYVSASPGVRFDALPPAEQQEIRTACAPPPASERCGPYSAPMYYLMHKGYAHEGDWDADPATRFYDKLKGTRGPDWGSWKLDRNRPDWQEAMIADWAELGLNSTHLNLYPLAGKLEIDPDWAQAVRDYVALSEKHGMKIGVRLDGLDETKLWTVHPNNPQSRRADYLHWAEQVAAMLKGRTVYFILGDELSLSRAAGQEKLTQEAWTPAMYLDYFREVATAVKRADPQAKVCMFAASSGEWQNVIWMLENGYAQVGDGVAINHYDFRTVQRFVADRDRLAPGKLFLASGVGYVSNGGVTKRYPEGDGYSPHPNEESHAAAVAKTMFAWWDLGADVAPYYLTVRSWVVEGIEYPRWFGFLGFEDYVVADDRLAVKRYPAWYAFQAVAHTFYNRDQMRRPTFEVSSSKPLSTLRAFVRDVSGGQELLVMAWNEAGNTPVELLIDSDQYRYPVNVSLKDYRAWESLDSEVQDGTTKIQLSVGSEPTIIRLVQRFPSDASHGQ